MRPELCNQCPDEYVCRQADRPYYNAGKPCVICPIYEICAQALKDSPCPVSGATEKDTAKFVYKED